MGIHELEYKRLLSQIKFKNEELEIIEESMRDIHVEFESYYSSFLQENNLTKQELEKSKTQEFGDFMTRFTKPAMPETDETGLVIVEQLSDEEKEAKVVFAKLYKDIVKICHPDRLSTDDMDHFNKMNTHVKAASWAYNNAKWAILIKVAEELKIKPSNYKKMNGHLRREIKTLDSELNKHKSSFGWRLYQEEDKEGKDNIIKDFIFQVFRRRL
jgi:hypothetical protein